MSQNREVVERLRLLAKGHKLNAVPIVTEAADLIESLSSGDGHLREALEDEEYRKELRGVLADCSEFAADIGNLELADRAEAMLSQVVAGDRERQALSAPIAKEPGEDEVERVRDILDRERYKVAIGVQRVRKALDSRRWLSEAGRGSYTYDDERYQQEFGAAIDEIETALKPLREIAGDWSDCPTDPLRVAANRDAAITALRNPRP